MLLSGSVQYLLYCDEPLTENSKLIRLSLAEAESKFGFKYTDEVFYGEYDNLDFGEMNDLDPIWERVHARRNNPLTDSLVICNMGEAGYGIFTRSKIDVGTMIGLYAGRVTPSSNVDMYGMSAPAMNRCGLRFSAAEYGNLTRFIQHLPYDINKIKQFYSSITDAETFIRFFDANGILPDGPLVEQIKAKGFFQKYREKVFQNCEQSLKNIDNNAKDDGLQTELAQKPYLLNQEQLISMANVLTRPILHGRKLYMYMQACVDIEPYTQVGITYGQPYWRDRRTKQMYFDMQGQIAKRETLKSTIAYKSYKLRKLASCFMRDPAWKLYPPEKLSKDGEFANHTCEYLNFNNQTKHHCEPMISMFNNRGFKVRRTQSSSGNPSIIVDLTASSCKKMSK